MEAKKLTDMEQSKMWPIEDVIPYEGNIKTHSNTQIRKIGFSIINYGWDQPIVVDEEGVIIKGHARLLAAKDIGLEEVPVVVNVDLSEEEVRAARIADNKVAQSEWDAEALWEEINDLKEDFSVTDMGFEAKQLRRLFPDFDLASIGVDPPPRDEKMKDYKESGGHDDYTKPQVEGFIAAFKGEEKWLRRLDMVDYLNWHEKILVGFSGGKDSLACLIWCLENCEREKVVPYFSNLAWGVDWPHGIAFVQLIEKMYDVKVFIAGSSDPASPGKFEDLLLQHGYMEPYSCWYRNYVKIRNVKAFLIQEGLHPKFGVNAVQLLAVRWDESPDRALTYPDRGILKDDSIHYASPLIRWTDGDVCHFLAERDIRLHTAYQHSHRMGCIVCPNEDRRGSVNTRKKFPLLWKQIVEWHAIGARRKGKIQKQHFNKMLMSISDMSPHELQMFQGLYGDIAMGSREFEEYVEEVMGADLPEHPYMTIPYRDDLHNFRNDLKPGALEDPTAVSETSCLLTG